jgi:hypothetical protein
MNVRGSQCKSVHIYSAKCAQAGNSLDQRLDRTSEVVGLFEDASFQTKTCRRLNLFPNFTQRLVFEC